MNGFQRLSLITIASVFVLICIGVTVRATDSGLGCPDWPRCHGSFIPRWETHTLIEYSHRLAASIVGLMVLSLTIMAWRSYRKVPAVLVPTTGALVLVVFQGGLGGATVMTELPAELVTLHLATAMSIITLLMITATAAFAHARPLDRPAVSSRLRSLSAVSALSVFVLMLVGSWVAGAGYSLACSGWPLCNGQLFPDANVASVQVHFLHRMLAVFAGVLLVTLAIFASRERGSSRLPLRLSHAALGLFALQVIIGASNIWTDVSDFSQIAHLAVGTLLWGTIAYLNIRVHGLHALLPYYRSDSPADLAGATR